jgi:predicted nucleic acid-binding protein
MSYTLDANVFVADAITTDVHHRDSKSFLNALSRRTEEIFCPTLVITETVAAIARPTGNMALALGEIRIIRTMARLKLVSLTIARSVRSARLASMYRLRGADSVYLAVAAECAATLITWDAEMLTRGAAVVTVMTPAQWLAAPPIII